MSPETADQTSSILWTRRKRGAQNALRELRLEIAVILLLLLTMAAIRYGDQILNDTVVISATQDARYTTISHSDQALGGRSTVETSRDQPLQWSCTLRPGYQYPFCSYEVVLARGTGRGLDLSRYRTISIDLDYAGSAESVRLYLKNFDRRYSDPGRRETLKLNRIELPVPRANHALRANLVDFDVAESWIQQSRIPFRYSRPQFDNIVAVEVQTGNGALPGRHQFRLRSITLQGSLLSMEQWYLGIIGCWIVLICLFLISRIVGLQRDLRDRRTLQYHALGEARRAQETARRDHLTGLLNRLGMSDSYRRMIAANGDRPVATILIDIDYFKSVNDRWGHMQGDEVLVAFAALLRRNVREDDLIGRWGGEEFLLLARVGDAQTAIDLANKLRGVIERTDFGVDRPITASFGVELAEIPPAALSTAVEHADRALYAAKEQGRNRVVFHQMSASPGQAHHSRPELSGEG